MVVVDGPEILPGYVANEGEHVVPQVPEHVRWVERSLQIAFHF